MKRKIKSETTAVATKKKMKPGQDSSPKVPAATPNKDAVIERMFETVCVANGISMDS